MKEVTHDGTENVPEESVMTANYSNPGPPNHKAGVLLTTIPLHHNISCNP